ncbi:MAG: LysM peptidoglycan-binding domain-containing protein [Bacilli bacterium]
MKQSIPFVKDLIFKTNIAEITSISLEKNINIEDDDMLSGDFTVTGKYKMTDASQNEEVFNYNIPFDIALDYRYIKDNSNIEITDFEYEIINDDVLRVKITIGIDGLEMREEVKKEVRDGDLPPSTPLNDFNEESIPISNELEEEIDTTEKIKSLFDSIDDTDETHSTYKVYIVREEDNLESIILKYNINKEELAHYNNIDDIKLGDKLIIPYNKNE